MAFEKKVVLEKFKHFKKFPKDFASRIGFLKMIGKRRRLLDYLKKSDKNAYSDILKKLGLRK